MGVLTTDRWGLSPARLAELEGHGVTLVHEDPLKGLHMAPVAFGETAVGELTHDEAVIFRANREAVATVVEIDREMQAEHMRAMAAKIEAHKDETGYVEVPYAEVVPTPPEGYWKTRQLAGHLHALLHYSMGERLGRHHEALGVRAGGVIVSLGNRSTTGN